MFTKEITIETNAFNDPEITTIKYLIFGVVVWKYKILKSTVY